MTARIHSGNSVAGYYESPEPNTCFEKECLDCGKTFEAISEDENCIYCESENVKIIEL